MFRRSRQRPENDGVGLDTRDVSQVTPGDQIGGTLDRVSQPGRTFQGDRQQAPPGGSYRQSNDAARLEDRPVPSNCHKVAIAVSDGGKIHGWRKWVAPSPGVQRVGPSNCGKDQQCAHGANRLLKK